jgi:hypothetical protein
MAQSGVIVRRLADTFPPNEFWVKVMEENPTAWGAVVESEVDGHKFLEINTGDGLDIEVIQATLTQFKDSNITFYFCNSEIAISDKDISPFILLATPAEDDPEQEEPRLVAFIEGNFPGYVKEKSSRPPEYHLVNDVLMPKLDGLFEMVDQDIDKLMENLKKPFFNKEMLSYSVSRGTITLVSSSGVCLNYAQNDLAREFPWGWTSNHYGFGDAAPQAELPKKKPSMFSGRSTVREKAPTGTKVEPSTEKIAAAIVPKATATAISDFKGWKIKKESPGGHLSRSEVKDYYKSKIGYLPPGSEQKVAVNVYVGPDNKVWTFSAMNKALGMQAAGLIALANNPKREVKDVQPDNVETQEALAATTEKPVSQEPLPIVSPKGREHMNTLRSTDKYRKMISEGAEAIADPKAVEGFETKFVDFAKAMGVKTMMEFACWDFPMMEQYCMTRPHDAAVMMDTFRNICIRKGYFKGMDVEGKTTEEPETVVPQKKPSMFSKAG